MTNTEVVVELEKLYEYHSSIAASRFTRALKRAIELISAEPCEDAISRSAVLDSLEFSNPAEAEFQVRRMPTASTRRKIGHWIQNDDSTCWICSECKEENIGIPIDVGGEGKLDPYIWLCSKFCPCCGAKMERD